MSTPVELEARRIELCEALFLPRTTPWADAIKDARSAGVVRDAEYCADERTREENERLHAENAELRAAIRELVQLHELSTFPFDLEVGEYQATSGTEWRPDWAEKWRQARALLAELAKRGGER